MPFRKYPPGESDEEWGERQVAEQLPEDDPEYIGDPPEIRPLGPPEPKFTEGVFVDGGHIRAVEVEGKGVRVTLAAASKAASAAVDVVLDRGQAIDLGVSLIKGALGQEPEAEPEPEAVER